MHRPLIVSFALLAVCCGNTDAPPSWYYRTPPDAETDADVDAEGDAQADAGQDAGQEAGQDAAGE